MTISAQQVRDQLALVGVKTQAEILDSKFVSGTQIRPASEPDKYPTFRLMAFPRTYPRIGEMHGSLDAHGIAWRKVDDDRGVYEVFWTGSTWYDNVQLTWIALTPHVDKRWEKMDESLKQLVQ
jgi:hypothetical protein